MYGVVLWSDPAVATAVIWCEDHGDLAFYKVPETPHVKSVFFLDAGDYVEFDVEVEDDMRRAVNARAVDAGYCPTIADTLSATRPANEPDRRFRDRSIENNKVIRMPQIIAAKARA